jgi:hypothetical protein
MSRSRALKGVASTLARVFVSRNNDADGYWGIGKLCKIAADCGATELIFNLLSVATEHDDSEDMQIIHQHFQALLQKQLRTAHLTHVPLEDALIQVQFGVAEDKLKGFERFGHGEAIECTVGLKLASGHSAVALSRCRAAPHNPKRESRRCEQVALTIESTLSASSPDKEGHMNQTHQE